MKGAVKMGKTNRKAGLFLIELIISIFFFSICCAVCVSLFAKAHNLSSENENRAQGLLKLQSAQSVLLKNDFENLSQMLCGKNKSDDNFVCFYDKNWQEIESEGAFCLQITRNSRDEFDFLVYETQNNQPILQQKITLHKAYTKAEVAYE